MCFLSVFRCSLKTAAFLLLKVRLLYEFIRAVYGCLNFFAPNFYDSHSGFSVTAYYSSTWHEKARRQ